MKRRRKLTWSVVILAGLAAALSFVSWQLHGHAIDARYAPNHGRPFDFREPPCEAGPQPETTADEVLVRYFGVGGLYIRWQGVALLTAPFFSNYGMLKVGLGDVEWDTEAIADGMAGLPADPIAAVLVGHTHYDHVGDLPPILREHASGAQLFAGRSGRNMLGSCEGIDARFVEIENVTERWVRLTDGDGRPLPVRIMPLESDHAPHLGRFRFATGQVLEPWDCFEGRKIRELVQGKTYAFLIDLLASDGETIAFRIHYQDAASGRPAGFPPREVLAERAVDLATLCMPSAHLAEGYPEGILEHTGARHALVTHYEDFFRHRDRPLRFVKLLTDGNADDFMSAVESEMTRTNHRAGPPNAPACGPSGPLWTMPLPGEWLAFPTG